ncbi:MAG TPA: hypothetical protein VJN71_05650 [Nitrososphaerales archaeon]|nr:hypothetical protein [Nitrososphaerales archaeon]
MPENLRDNTYFWRIVIATLGREIGLKVFNRRLKSRVPETVKSNERRDILKSLCGNDGELYEALSNFLFLDPRSYEKNVDTMSRLMQKGKDALENGNRLYARVSFEEAARLALYSQDKGAVENSLGLAEEAAEEKSEVRHRMHETLLTNLGRALNIASEYYKSKYGSSETEKAEYKTPEMTPIPISVEK